MPAAANGMNGFQTVNDVVSLSPGDPKKSRDDIDSPTVILIFGWMGAQLPHLHKYTKAYQEMFPASAQILVRSQPSFFWSSQKKRESALIPVVEHLKALECLSSNSDVLFKATSSRILVHSFSNGGSYQLTTLCRLLRRNVLGPSTTLTSAIIIDSSPGSGGLRTTKLAFTGLLQNSILRFLANILITVVYMALRTRGWLLGSKSPIENLKNALNNPNLLPWVDARTPRLYIYSRKDELVPWNQIADHANQSEASGINTKSLVFEDSPHVAHARTDPSKYWGAVKQIWEEAYAVRS